MAIYSIFQYSVRYFSAVFGMLGGKILKMTSNLTKHDKQLYLHYLDKSNSPSRNKQSFKMNINKGNR